MKLIHMTQTHAQRPPHKGKQSRFYWECALRLHKSIKILNVKGKLASGGHKDCSYANMHHRLSPLMYTHAEQEWTVS